MLKMVPEYKFVNKDLLIDHVRKEPRLWDSKLKYYKDTDLKNVLWKNIGNKMRVDGNVVKKVWINLRNTYRKFLKLQIIALRNGKVETKHEKWQYFKEMSFLRDVMVKKKRRGKKLSGLSASSSSTHDLSKKKRSTKIKKTLKSDESDNSSDSDLESNRKIGDKIIKKCAKKTDMEFDEDYLFLMSLLPLLKKFDNEHVMNVRIKIMETISEEMQELNYRNPQIIKPLPIESFMMPLQSPECSKPDDDHIIKCEIEE